MERYTETLLKENDNAFYVFDIARVKERMELLRRSLPEGVELCYAVKANPFIPGYMTGMAERFEICSPGEADICFECGVPKDKMVISGVYKTPSFIERLVADKDFDGIFTAESLSQYELLRALSERYGRRLTVLLRLTNGSQFGMNDTDIERIVSERESTPLIDIAGIQYFSGTQKTSVKKFRRELTALDAFIVKLGEDYGFTARELEYGAGFPAAYFEEDSIDEGGIFEGFSECLSEFVSKPRIIIELGRSIAASCGKYYTHIVDMKENKGQKYLLIDGGMHHLVYFGQVMAIKRPFVSVVGSEDVPPQDQWTVCGSLCSMNDIVVKQLPLPPIKTGDVLCFENTGAYCMTEGVALFLSRDLPAVYIIDTDGTLYRARRSFETKEHNISKNERMY